MYEEIQSIIDECIESFIDRCSELIEILLAELAEANDSGSGSTNLPEEPDDIAEDEAINVSIGVWDATDGYPAEYSEVVDDDAAERYWSVVSSLVVDFIDEIEQLQDEIESANFMYILGLDEE